MMIAQTLMEHRLHHSKDLPTNDRHPEYNEMIAQITHATHELDDLSNLIFSQLTPIRLRTPAALEPLDAIGNE